MDEQCEKCLNERGISVEQGRIFVCDRSEMFVTLSVCLSVSIILTHIIYVIF